MAYFKNGASWCALACASTAAAATILSAKPARAHFILEAPTSWMVQDSEGFPEKLGPCGDEYDDDGGTPSNVITHFQAGQTITITIDEVVFHPGHYRVALAADDRSELPAEPTVTATSADPCDSAAIESPAVYPVLADDVLDHTMQFTSPQSFQVTLPTNVTCTNCTLQVIEFMSDHALNIPGGCFYHHCANISIMGGTSAASSSGGGSSSATSSGGAASSSGGSTSNAGDAAASSGGSVDASLSASSANGSTTTSQGSSSSNGGSAGSSAGRGSTPPSSAAGSQAPDGSTSGGSSSGCAIGDGTAPSLFGVTALAAAAAFVRRRRRITSRRENP